MIHEKLKKGMSITTIITWLFSSMFVLLFHAAPASAATPVSTVDNSLSTYDRQVLNVDGKPFFYNGVQIRIDKLKDVYGYTDTQLQNLFTTAKNDGFTVVNSQIRWMDIQPDQHYQATESTYIRGGSYSSTNFSSESSITTQYSTDDSSKQLAYIKFDLSSVSTTSIAGAKIRVYANTVTGTPKLRLYGITDDTWNASTMTWNTGAPNHTGYDISGTGYSDLGTTPSYDPVNSVNYYDYDVTDFINNYGLGDKKASFIVRSDSDTTDAVSLDGSNGTRPPELILSRDDVYDWSYVDKAIGWAETAGIKLEILWFGTDTVNISMDNRVPFYAFHKYQKSLKADKTPFFEKRTDPTQIYGIYWYLLSKNDPNLRVQEKAALKALFNHIADYDAAHNHQRTVIGCQVANEPAIGKLHNVTMASYSYDDYSLAAKGNLTAQQFRDQTMWEYTTNLADAVKESNYSVWTRVNNFNGTDAVGVAYNESKRSSGTSLDFIGLDPYSSSTSTIYNFGHSSTYAQGDNLAMVMENGGSYNNSQNLVLASLAGGAFYNVYDLVSPDGYGLYKNNAGNTLSKNGSYVDKVISTNNMLNNLSEDFATKRADGDGGTKLKFYNPLATASSTTTKNIRSVDVTYSTTNSGIGIAVERSPYAIALASSTASSFTLKGAASYGINLLTEGYYNGPNWISTGTASYTVSGNDIIVNMNAYSSVRFLTNNPIPETSPVSPTILQAEDATLSGPIVASSSAGYTGTGYADYQNASGDYIEFNVNMASAGTNTLVFTYASTSDRPLELKVNGTVVDSALPFNSTGSWTTWSTTSKANVTLNAGMNTIRITATGLSGGNIDKLEIQPDQPSSTVLQAEDATLSGPIVASSSAGYTGTGYADYQNASGDYIEFTVNMASAGTKTLVFTYASTSDRPLELKVNGTVVDSALPFNSTGSWTTWSTTSKANVSLNAGMNTIRITAAGSSGGNIDKLEIQ